MGEPGVGVRLADGRLKVGDIWVRQLAEATSDAGSWEREFDRLVLGLSGRLVGDEAERLGFLCRRAVHLMRSAGDGQQ